MAPLIEWGVCKKFSGMLNVLPYMVSVKRETQHLVARKWGYPVEKEARFQGFEVSVSKSEDSGACLEPSDSETLKP